MFFLSAADVCPVASMWCSQRHIINKQWIIMTFCYKKRSQCRAALTLEPRFLTCIGIYIAAIRAMRLCILTRVEGMSDVFSLGVSLVLFALASIKDF